MPQLTITFCARIVFLTGLFFSFHSNLFAQQKVLGFLHDTLILEHEDSIYYHRGDAVNASVKYGRWGFTTEIDVKEGRITRYSHYGKNGIKTSERLTDLKTNFSTIQGWNEDGILMENGYFSGGMEDSVWTYYRNDGTKEMECRYLADTTYRIDEFHTVWGRPDLETGEATISHSMGPQSPPHGAWVFYDQREKVIKRLWFDRGVLVGIEFGEIR
jgi:hypothetical protein